MGFNIAFDYRFDSSGFFTNPAVRAALEAAGDIWESLIQDEFQNVGAGTIFTIDNPSNSGQTETITLTQEIDDLLIFVGAQALSGPLAVGGYDGTNADGDAFSSRISGNFRNTGPVTDFEPWAGTISFDPAKDWSFDLAGPVADKIDLIVVALHEIGHVLGVGTAPIFDFLGAGALFDGFNALAVSANAGIPLEADLAHVINGYASDTVVMDPFVNRGTRIAPSVYDKALLADIGYQIVGYTAQGSTPALTTSGADVTVYGTILGDYIDGMEGNDQIQGADGGDTLLGGAGNDTIFGEDGNDLLLGGAGNDQIQGGAGNDTLRNGTGDDWLYGGAGRDTYEIRANGGGLASLYDFDLATEVIRLVGSGFASAAAAVAAITKIYSNVSHLTFGDGTSIDVFHGSQSGTPLTAANFEIIAATPYEGSYTDDTLTGDAAVDILEGFGGNDRLEGGEGNDSIYGGDGVDTLIGGLGDDFIFGGTSSADLRDVIYGGDGNDYLDGGYGNDELRGDAGNDTLEGGFGADTVIGGTGNDVLTGAAWGDLLYGGDGNDFINGGFGYDRVNGGAGADKFYHLGVAGHGSDWIQDYNSAAGDVLMFGGGAAAPDDFLVQRAFTPNAGQAGVREIFVTQVSTGNLLWALVDGDAQAQINIQIQGQVFDLLA